MNIDKINVILTGEEKEKILYTNWVKKIKITDKKLVLQPTRRYALIVLKDKKKITAYMYFNQWEVSEIEMDYLD